MRKILGTITALVTTFLVTTCGENKQQFTVAGEIEGGTGKTLYLENVGVAKIVAIDSVHLKSNRFKFRHKRPAVPDFYRLRLGRQVINLAIDSTETIHVKADTARFGRNYSLEGDVCQSQKIKELTLLQIHAASQYRDLQKQYESGELSADGYVKNVSDAIDAYKTAAKEFILSDFLSLPAYFALFQQINNLLIFDIYNKDDHKLFGAVANVWNMYYPESPRAIQLKKLFTEARNIMRGEQQSFEVQEADSKTLFDIALPTLTGEIVRLSEIGDGKITLIDFTIYSASESPAYNSLLAELYKRYHSRGLEIYQVSLDANSHLWKNAAVNLPWICVRDPESAYSTIAQRYNVISIPAAFIRNRKGEIVTRIEDYSKLDALIAGCLK